MQKNIHYIKRKIIEVLASLKIKVQPTSMAHRYTCIRFRFELLSSGRISKSRLLEAEDLLYQEVNLSAKIRKNENSIVVELPNPCPPVFFFDDVKEELRKTDYILPLALGRTDYGRDVIVDLWKLPHLLIGGSGSEGMQNLLDTMIASISEVRTPEEVRFILVDIEGNAFDKYSDSAYLMEDGLIKDYDALFETLEWLDNEIFRRYGLLVDMQCRNIMEYNEESETRLPYLTLIVNDIVPIQMDRGKDFETYLCKIAAKARAAGIHIVVASSKASADIITGIVKNNMPARIAFRTDTELQSRVIIDNADAIYLHYPDDILFSAPQSKSVKQLKGYQYKSCAVTEGSVLGH